MTVLQFISSTVSSLAWPLLIGATLIAFRKPLRRLFTSGPSGRAIKRLKAGPVEMEWEARLEDAAERAAEATGSAEPTREAPVAALEENLLQMAELAPNAAVMLAYQRIEKSLRQTVETDPDFDPPRNRRLTTSDYARRAVELEILTDPMYETFQDLRRLRNEVTHGGYVVDIDQSVRYVETALLVLSGLRRPGEFI